jgi:hypothetical protein
VLRSLLSPVWSSRKKVVVRVELMTKHGDFSRVTTNPPDGPGQVNKVFGYAVLGLPHWWSVRVGYRLHMGRVEWCMYRYRNGKRREVYAGVGKVLNSGHLVGPDTFELDLDWYLRYGLPWWLKWLPVFRLHSFFGGKVPAPFDIDSYVTEW